MENSASKADIQAQGMARRDYGFSAFPHAELGRQTDRCQVVIYFTQVASFSPYRLWSDLLLPRHI
jgi:hypothetical protein